LEPETRKLYIFYSEAFNMTSNLKFQFLLLFIVWAVLAVVFAVYDLQISQALYNPDSTWAQFLEAYGQIPGLIVALLCSGVLLRLRGWRSNFRDIVINILITLCAILASGVIWADLQGVQVGEELSLQWTLALGLITLVVLQLGLHRIPHESLERYEKPARVGLLLFITAPLVTTWILKITWGRVTFRDLAADYENFTRWYLPQGITGHRSFISGHTGFGWMVLPLTLLARKGGRTYGFVWAVVILWGTAVAVSRVVIGAHYASDVLFATCVAFLWFMILKARIMGGKG
jgi:membrane-associated phospholipid phosphatase